MMQLRAFAGQDGLLLALVWAASFAAILYLPQSLLGTMLAVATPFVVGWRLLQFRNKVLDGVITFGRGFTYCLLMFVYASLLFCVGQFLYFRFIDNGTFHSILLTAMQVMQEMYKSQPEALAEIKTNFDTILSLTPIQLSLAFMMQNIFMGTLFSLPLALLFMRRGPYKRNNKKQI